MWIRRTCGGQGLTMSNPWHVALVLSEEERAALMDALCQYDYPLPQPHADSLIAKINDEFVRHEAANREDIPADNNKQGT